LSLAKCTNYRTFLLNTLSRMTRITPAALETVRQRFFLRGETVAGWARANSFDERQVYAVLSGRNQATRGRAHLIAVALGLKPQLDVGSGESTRARKPDSL
jgi:gp16 family phage-associated protein